MFDTTCCNPEPKNKVYILGTGDNYELTHHQCHGGKMHFSGSELFCEKCKAEIYIRDVPRFFQVLFQTLEDGESRVYEDSKSRYSTDMYGKVSVAGTNIRRIAVEPFKLSTQQIQNDQAIA